MHTKPNSMISNQRGMTFIGWILIIILLGFAAMIAFRTLPVYLTYFKVSSSFQEIGNEYELQDANLETLRDALRRRLNINEIEVVDESDARLKKKANGVRILYLEYQVTKPIFGNAYLLFKFHPKAKLAAH